MITIEFIEMFKKNDFGHSLVYSEFLTPIPKINT